MLSYNEALTRVLNFAEKLAIVVENDLADEVILKQFFRGIVVGYYHDFRDFIDLKRRERKNDKIFEKFFWLASRWGG